MHALLVISMTKLTDCLQVNNFLQTGFLSAWLPSHKQFVTTFHKLQLPWMEVNFDTSLLHNAVDPYAIKFWMLSIHGTGQKSLYFVLLHVQLQQKQCSRQIKYRLLVPEQAGGVQVNNKYTDIEINFF